MMPLAFLKSRGLLRPHRPTKSSIVFVGIALLVFAGAFYFWQDQKDVYALNKKLPEGVRIIKNLNGDEYKIANKIDDYEFKIPAQWGGLSVVEYTPERTEGGYTASSIFVMGKEGEARVISVDAFKVSGDENLKEWARGFFGTFKFTGELEEKQLADLTVVVAAEDPQFGSYLYFAKVDSKIYLFSGGSEEAIKYVIRGGRW